MDPIANMLTSIRNAQAARLATVTVPASRVKLAILALLKREGFIEGYELDKGPKATLTISLRYENRQPAISHLRRISKPGLRIYRKRSELPRPLSGLGMAIISTPKGVITNKEARKLGLGGEIICEVW